MKKLIALLLVVLVALAFAWNVMGDNGKKVRATAAKKQCPALMHTGMKAKTLNDLPCPASGSRATAVQSSQKSCCPYEKSVRSASQQCPHPAQEVRNAVKASVDVKPATNP